MKAPKPEASADSSEETAPVDGDGEPIPETFAVATQTDLPDEQNAASDPELEDPVETPQPEPDMDESTETPQPEPDVNESVEPPSLSRKQIKTWSRAPVPVEDIEASGNEGLIEQPEAGARFQIYLTRAGSYDAAKESERDLLVTDADGVAVSKDLPYGRYTVHQIEGMEGQAFIPDFTVFINADGQLYSYILNNLTISSFIRVEKHDAETGKIIPAAGVGFQIRDLSTGELISQTVYYPTPITITTFYTADDGSLMLPYELPYGQYELIEVETCYGYVLDSQPVPFTVDGTSDVVTVTKHNVAQKGLIHISKTGEIFSTVVNESELYQPVYEVAGLEGAVYSITALEDVYTLDGTLRASAGEVMRTSQQGQTAWRPAKRSISANM